MTLAACLAKPDRPPTPAATCDAKQCKDQNHGVCVDNVCVQEHMVGQADDGDLPPDAAP